MPGLLPAAACQAGTLLCAGKRLIGDRGGAGVVSQHSVAIKMAVKVRPQRSPVPAMTTRGLLSGQKAPTTASNGPAGLGREV